MLQQHICEPTKYKVNKGIIRVLFIRFYIQIQQLMVASCILGSISTHAFLTHHGYGCPGMFRLLTFSLNHAAKV